MNIRARFGLIVASIIGMAALVEVLGYLMVPSWMVSATAVSSASPKQIWSWYTDAATVPRWDHLVRRVTIDGSFASGVSGSNLAANGMILPWRLTNVIPDKQYTEISTMPLATLTATHVISLTAHGTQIDHTLSVSGPGAWIYRTIAYNQMHDGIQAAMGRLATGAAHGLPQSY